MTRPDTRRFGPYKVLQLLGQGGMGLVHLAEHVETGRRVALKTLKSPGVGHRKALRRELRALRALSHPGVVEVLDEGFEGETPWFAMAWIQGEPLSVALAQARAPSTPIPEARETRGWTHHISALATAETMLSDEGMALPEGVTGPPRSAPTDPRANGIDKLPEELLGPLRQMAQVAHALAYIHGEGVAHLDLKPDNILVTPRGQAVLVDFGLAQQLGHRVRPETLEETGVFAGTAGYISPERAQGLPLDARADLYALGCILYRAVTGRPPFQGQDVVALARQHISSPPTPPSALGVSIPRALEGLIMGLLAKSPHMRPPHAGVVLRVLEELGVEVTPQDTAPTARTHLYRSELLGRQGALSRLQGALGEVCAGARVAAAVFGESGVGKSRLAETLIGEARQRGARVVICQSRAPMASDAGRARPPLHTFEGLWRTLEEVLGRRAEDGAPGLEGASALTRYAPRLAPWLGEAEGTPANAVEARDELVAALGQALRALEDRPLVMVFEDVHWADALSLEVLERALELAGASRMTLLLSQSTQTPAALDGIMERAGVQRIELPRLPPEVVGQILRQMMSAATGPTPSLESLVSASEGNPLFAIEHLRLAVDRGTLRLDDQGRWEAPDPDEAPAAPRTVQEIIAARLEALTPEAHRLACAAAVLGHAFELELLEAVCELERGAMDRALGVLERRAVLELDGDAARFAHGKLREVAYGMPSASWRRDAHRRIARALEARRQRGATVTALALAPHLELGGDTDEAIDAWLEAAEVDAMRFALEAAEGSYLRAIELAGERDVRGARARWRLSRAVLLYQTRLDEASQRLEEALALLRTTDDVTNRWGSLMALSQIRVMRGRLEEASALLEEASAVLERDEDLTKKGRVQVTAGIVAYMRADMATAQAHWERALEYNRQQTDGALESTVRINLAMLHQMAGRHHQAREHLGVALAYYREAGNKEGEGSAMNNLLDLMRTQGDVGEGFDRLFAQTEALWLTLGDAYSRAYALQSRGEGLRLRGDLEGARAALELALGLRRELGDALNESASRAALAEVALDAGQLDEARAHIEAIRALEQLEGSTRARAALAEVRLRRMEGDLDAVAGALEIAEAALQGSEACLERIAHLCERGHLALARAQDAQSWLQQARLLYAQLELEPTSDAGQRLAELATALGSP